MMIKEMLESGTIQHSHSPFQIFLFINNFNQFSYCLGLPWPPDPTDLGLA